MCVHVCVCVAVCARKAFPRFHPCFFLSHWTLFCRVLCLGFVGLESSCFLPSCVFHVVSLRFVELARVCRSAMTFGQFVAAVLVLAHTMYSESSSSRGGSALFRHVVSSHICPLAPPSASSSGAGGGGFVKASAPAAGSAVGSSPYPFQSPSPAFGNAYDSLAAGSPLFTPDFGRCGDRSRRRLVVVDVCLVAAYTGATAGGVPRGVSCVFVGKQLCNCGVCGRPVSGVALKSMRGRGCPLQQCCGRQCVPVWCRAGWSAKGRGSSQVPVPDGVHCWQRHVLQGSAVHRHAAPAAQDEERPQRVDGQTRGRSR